MELLQRTRNEGADSKFSLDPRTKLLVLAMVTALMFGQHVSVAYVGLAAIPFLLLWSNQQWKLALLYLVLFIAGLCANELPRQT